MTLVNKDSKLINIDLINQIEVAPLDRSPINELDENVFSQTQLSYDPQASFIKKNKTEVQQPRMQQTAAWPNQQNRNGNYMVSYP